MLALALAFLASPSVSEIEPSSPARPFALVLAKNLAADPEIARRVERYCQDVEKHGCFKAIVAEHDATLAPEDLRRELQGLAKQHKIQGALLVGGFRFQKFKNAVNEVSAFPEYFEDLDGVFKDEDGDGVLDFYDPWSKDRDEDALEIWVAALRPYDDEAQGENAPPSLTGYFDKLHDIAAREIDTWPARATIFTSKDWAHQETLTRVLEDLYGNEPALYGGLESKKGAAIATSPKEFAQAAAEACRLLFVFAHSGPSRHHLDRPAGPAGQIVPFERESAEQVLLEELELGARAVVIWGCHGLDLEGIDYAHGRFLANSYCFTSDFACETVLGTARSIGMESVEVFAHALKDEPLPVAWLAYVNHLYREPYLHDWLGVRSAWEKERTRFNWSYLLYGNPFAELGPAEGAKRRQR